MFGLLALFSLSQVPEAPETSLVYAGMPQISTADGVRLDMAWHTVTMVLDKESAKVSCVTLFKNMSDKPVNAQVRIPVYVQGWSTNYGRNVSVRWADNLVSPSSTATEEEDSQTMRNAAYWRSYNVTFRPRAQRSLKTEMTLPIQVTGPDGMERQVAYEFGPTANELETMSMAVKYPASLVYRTIESSPRSWGWQVGATGAFMKRENVRLGQPTLAKFRFYRGGFEKIGDGQ